MIHVILRNFEKKAINKNKSKKNILAADTIEYKISV